MRAFSTVLRVCAKHLLVLMHSLAVVSEPSCYVLPLRTAASKAQIHRLLLRCQRPQPSKPGAPRAGTFYSIVRREGGASGPAPPPAGTAEQTARRPFAPPSR